MLRKFNILNEQETSTFISQLVELCDEGTQVLCFHGDLGAGKTTYIKQLCSNLGVTGGMSSPSFAIVNEYWSEKNGTIYHFDLYRLNDPQELLGIGWEDYLNSQAILLVEWPEKGANFIPDDAIHIFINHSNDPDSRLVIITDQPKHYV